MKVLKEKK